MLRKVTGMLLAVGCTMTMIAGAALAQDAAQPRINSTVDATYLTKYIWRGQVLDNDAVFQPSLKMAFPSGLSYKLMLNDSTNSTAVAGKIGRQEHTLDYPTTFFGQNINLGFTYYANPAAGAQSTSEFYTKFNFGGTLKPTVCVNYDVDEVQGLYANVGGSYSVAVPYINALDFSLNVGMGNGAYSKQYAGGKDEFTVLDVVAGASTKVSLGGGFSLVPSVQYVTMLDKDLRDAAADKDNVVVGVSLQSNF